MIGRGAAYRALFKESPFYPVGADQGVCPLRFVRFSVRALESGVEEHSIEGVLVRVYNPAKTVADCFKFRNKIGLDVALEALRDCRRQRICTNDDLWHYAKICRMTNVMKPYMEAIA